MYVCGVSSIGYHEVLILVMYRILGASTVYVYMCRHNESSTNANSIDKQYLCMLD